MRNSELLEELGQVSFLYTDKTGTLTKNEMILKSIYLLGREFIYDTESQSLLKSFSEDDKKEGLEFFEFLALCHDVFVDVEASSLVYEASSIDEGALVEAARKEGVVLKHVGGSSMVLEIEEKKVEK